MHVIETRRESVWNSTVLQMANNDSDTLANKTLLQIAAGDLPEYFAPFILNVPCQQVYPWNYTIDRFEELTGLTNLTDLKYDMIAMYIERNKAFFESEREAMRVKKEEVKKLAHLYGVELDEFLEAQDKKIEEVLSMNLFDINSLFCYNSLLRYSKRRGTPLSDIAAMLNLTAERLKTASFEQCRTLLPTIIVKSVQSTLGYPAATTDRLLGCNLAPARDVHFVDWCSLIKHHSLAFALEMYGKLRITVHWKNVLEIAAFIGINATDHLTCRLGIRNNDDVIKLSK